ncbi:uncharacterized protein LOC118281736 [Spodoptera frugiperda]|uniref:Uncharacterized protein LOC118281736 n=1 Tax=Spodoptera frugiperda TaxID=7108 RepID=A0A9R0DKE9_SPOFR|nr:uncharacterized protein LOC118281736 [Spodoptera frugiperda]
MWFNILLLFVLFTFVAPSDDNDEPVLYYYGLEESERSLPLCNDRQACSALILRYWRAPALVRLCRCARRMRCDTRAHNDSLIELNNRAHLQFCKPVTDWPECNINENALSIVTTHYQMNPDKLEELHHVNMQLTPPNITFNCRCRNPNYWKLSSTEDTNRKYRCASLPLCKTGEFCGNVNHDLNALYQSCLCPKHHICVHNGGVTHMHISELLYEGRGWKAYCQRIENDDSYEDY